jgi:metallophosphoesterase (TIGR03767 family)
MTRLLPGDPGAGGYRRLRAAPDEEMLLRRDLGGAAPGERRRSLVSFVQLSDLHVTDAQSPARAEYLDRLGDPDRDSAEAVGRVGLYRPQEALTHQVVEAMTAAVRRVPGGPGTGVPVSFAVVTGDSTDNAQSNELEAYLALLDGGRIVRPDSGLTSRDEGVGSFAAYDTRYYHPDGTPLGEQDDLPRAARGFPLVPGLFDAARRPFFAAGLSVPWCAVYGNHDALVGGTLPLGAELAALAIGERKPIGADSEPLALLSGNETAAPAQMWGLLSAPTRPISPDPRRRLVSAQEWIAAHGVDGRASHGFCTTAREDGRAFYAFDAGDIRFLVLDTVNRAGGWQGSLGGDQMDWLEEELLAGHRSFLAPSGRRVSHDRADRAFVLLSHHSLGTLTNDFAPDGHRRYLRADVERLLARFPNVLAWLNGHTHAHRIRAHLAARAVPGARGGFFEVTTASHIDWPQQARLVELACDEQSGQIVLFTRTLDHCGLVDPRAGELGDPLTLAGWSRELALNAWQGRAGSEPIGRGAGGDRSAALVLDVPGRLAARLGGLRALLG